MVKIQSSACCCREGLKGKAVLSVLPAPCAGPYGRPLWVPPGPQEPWRRAENTAPICVALTGANSPPLCWRSHVGLEWLFEGLGFKFRNCHEISPLWHPTDLQLSGTVDCLGIINKRTKAEPAPWKRRTLSKLSCT